MRAVALRNERDQNRFGIALRETIGHGLADIRRARRTGVMMVVADAVEQRQQIVVVQLAAAQDDRPSDFDTVVDEQENEVERRVGVVGQLLGQRDADRHLHVARSGAAGFRA